MSENPKQHRNSSHADYSPEEPVRPEMAEAMAVGAALRERELCKRDACMHCAGRSAYKRLPIGPNAAGNFEHEPPDHYISSNREPVAPVLCTASAIFARERFEENRRDAIEGKQITLQAPEFVDLTEPLSVQQILSCFPPEAIAPLPIILFCPQCGTQHIDLPNAEKQWDNPPHRSHECQACGFIWRPADIPTTGVAEIQTRGKADSGDRLDGSISMWWRLPWDSGALRDWSICGMNHYFLKDSTAAGRHLFVAMARAGRVIKAEGPSEVAVFLHLRKQAEAMNEIIAAENK